MDLALTAADEAFRLTVRTFFEQEYPRRILNKVRAGVRLTRADHVESQQALQSRGWFGISWPVQFGGPGWTPLQRYLFERELERAGAPSLIPMAVIYFGPVLAAFGSPAQRERWLPDILASRAMWAQGYSEPEAGSDLASLRMSATRDGDVYVVSGTKIWTTLAQWADWIFCLVRTSTSGHKHAGISFLCVDLKSSGIRIEPIITMNGAWELNRVVFDNVRVPCENRIGEEGRGWEYANFLLQNERLSYAHLGRKRADLRDLRRLAAGAPGPRGLSLLQDPLFAARLAAIDIQVDVLEVSILRALAGPTHIEAATVATLKIKCTECAQQITELYMELAGRGAMPFPERMDSSWQDGLLTSPAFAPQWTDAYLFERAQTIYGGTSEIQKSILWKQIGR